MSAFDEVVGPFNSTSITVNSGASIYSGPGSPETVLVAVVGSIYMRTDGGANTTVYRKESGAGNTGWVAVSNAGGGGGSPGGANTEVQFNDAGVFDGDPGLTFDKATQTLGLLGIDPEILVAASTANPSLPATQRSLIYSKEIAGQTLLHTADAVGVPMPVQDSLAFNRIEGYFPGTGTTPTALAVSVVNVGTISHPTMSSISLLSSIKKFVIRSAATAGALASHRCSIPALWRGNEANLGGFRVVLRFNLTTLQAGNRGFFGITDLVAAATNVNPLTSTAGNKIGMAFNTNTGNWGLVHNGNGVAPTVIDLGNDFPINNSSAYELILHCGPNASNVGYRIKNIISSNEVSGSLTTNLPANNVFLAPYLWMTNNATAAAVEWALHRWVSDSDF